PESVAYQIFSLERLGRFRERMNTLQHLNKKTKV
ncbi:hypothetical protein MIMGU_mgv11b018808mg, partial [Erythranthe guttata]